MTRSRLFMTAAVSMNAPDFSSSREARSATGKRPASVGNSSLPGPFCKLNGPRFQRPPGREVGQRDGSLHVPGVRRAASPGDADFEPADCGHLLPPMLDQFRVGDDIGDVRGDGGQRCAKKIRHAQQGSMHVEVRQRRVAGHQLIDPGRPRKRRTRAA